MKQVNSCPKCGGELEICDELYKCSYCNGVFDIGKTNDIEEKMRDLLDDVKQEKVSNLRRQLWDVTHEKYPSKKKIAEISSELMTYIPDDFLVQFFYTVSTKSPEELNDFLNSIDTKENYHLMDIVIETMLGILEDSNLLAVNNIIENTYKKNNSSDEYLDLPTYEKYASMLSKAADKLNAGVYDLQITRDVFVAYSSKDMKVVDEVVKLLEAEDIKCFVAMRNLRHGLGSKENYDEALRTAMDNSKIFLFISTPNSRSRSCDALKKEIPYIKKKDQMNAPAEVSNFYEKIPPKYKKPRIHLIIGEKPGDGPADEIVNEFFNGFEWVYSAKAAVQRAYKILDDAYVETPVQNANVPVSNDKGDLEKLLKRASLLIEDNDFKKATEVLDGILDKEPECSKAYLLKTLIDLNCNTTDNLKKVNVALEQNKYFSKAMKFAKGYEVKELEDLLKCVKDNVLKNKESYFNNGLKLKKDGNYEGAIAIFRELGDYKGAQREIKNCEQLLFKEKDVDLAKARDFIKQYKFDDAIFLLEKIEGHRDSAVLLEQAEKLKEKEENYQRAKLLATYKDYDSVEEAADTMEDLIGYRDAKTLAKQYNAKAKKLARKQHVSTDSGDSYSTGKRKFRWKIFLWLLVPYVGWIIFPIVLIVRAIRGTLYED